jgi:hypothetical protein
MKVTTVKNTTIPEFLRELEQACEELAGEYRRVTEAELRVRPAEGEWSFLETAQHVAPIVRFWIIWTHNIRGSLRGLGLVGTPPLQKTVFTFQHPSLDGVTIAPLGAALEEMRQVVDELVELLGWIPQEEYEMVVPAFSEEDRTRMAATPPGHFYTLALPTDQQREGLGRLLEYAGGFSVRGACGHVLEGHTRNHIRQMAAAREAAAKVAS